MPITAALSRTLHEALGHEAAADLVDWMQQVDTHRVELRELNELNYARIEARFQATDARISEVRHELLGEVGALRMDMRDGFADVRSEMRTGFAELKIAIARTESKIDSRYAEVLKWSFVFWCGTVAAGVLAARLR